MNELSALWQSAPWLVAGGALVLINIVLLILKITKKLIILAIGVALLAVGKRCWRCRLCCNLTYLSQIMFLVNL